MATIPVSPNDNEPLLRATYGCGATGFTPAATPTGVWEMFNPAQSGRVMRVKQLTFGAGGSAAGFMGAALKKTRALSTGGTPVVATVVAHDSRSRASVATVRHFTANPTVPSGGSLVGVVHAGRLGFTTGGQVDRLGWQFAWVNDKPIVLRPGEGLVLDLLGGTVPASGVLDWDLEFTEEIQDAMEATEI